MIKIIPLSAFNDNYIWMIMHPGNNACVVVDPGEAEPVLSALDKQGLHLAGILITHHHWDHTKGIAGLLAKHSVPVFGSAKEKTPLVNEHVQEGDNIEIAALDLH